MHHLRDVITICRKVLQHPFPLEVTPPNVNQPLVKIDKSKNLERLGQNSKEFAEIESLVLKSWCHKDGQGTESTRLSDKSIEITYIYRIKRPGNTEAYQSLSAECLLPVELKPVLTSPTVHENDNRCAPTPSSSLHTDMAFEETKDYGTAESASNENDMRQNRISKTNHDTAEKNPLLGKGERKHLEHAEWKLFHGTPINNVMLIVKYGFDLTKANAGLYGKGLYFAESSEKADHYADPKYLRRSHNLTMLVVRVKPGKVKCQYSPGEQQRRTEETGTVVAGLDKRFREFILFDEKRCLPEYVVVYNRVNKHSNG